MAEDTDRLLNLREIYPKSELPSWVNESHTLTRLLILDAEDESPRDKELKSTIDLNLKNRFESEGIMLDLVIDIGMKLNDIDVQVRNRDGKLIIVDDNVNHRYGLLGQLILAGYELGPRLIGPALKGKTVDRYDRLLEVSNQIANGLLRRGRYNPEIDTLATYTRNFLVLGIVPREGEVLH